MLGQHAIQSRLGRPRQARPYHSCKVQIQSYHIHHTIYALPHDAPQPGSSSHSAKTAHVSGAMLMQRARQLYEEVWSTGRVTLLENIMAENHQQLDWVWQSERAQGDPMTGRKQMKRGILAYRSAYPDMKFTINACAPDEAKAQVFVHWQACGTNTGPVRDRPPSGAVSRFSGISLLQLDAQGLIATSHVYRQAPSDEAAYFLGQQAQGQGPAPAGQQQEHIQEHAQEQ